MPDEERGAGWLTFSAIILVFAGIMKIFDSIWAFRAKNTLGDGDELPFATLGSNLKAYGVYWLILGILLIFAGYGVLQKAQWARWFGIIVAAIAAIASMSWMPYYPLWAFTYVLIALLVIYGLSAYGGLNMPDLPDLPSSGNQSSNPPNSPPPA
jgi:membrane protein implicated in regulation of membrane protease activity